MEYFNGVRDVDVSDIDCLKNMTQETANAIATGPQDAFFTLLDNFNHELKNFKQVCPKEMIDKLSNPLSLKTNISKAI